MPHETIPAEDTREGLQYETPPQVSDRLQREIDQSMRNALAMGQFMDTLFAAFLPKVR